MFKTQEVYGGFGAREKIADILARENAGRVFAVCGAPAFLPMIAPFIERTGAAYTVFGGFAPNPVYEDILAGAALFLKDGCDFLLSVGGGSAIDVAKCVNLHAGGEDGRVRCRHLAVPTTAGTGSEATHFAVMYKNGEKQSVADKGLLPDFVILDPHFLRSLPEYQKKATMMDALCQAAESYWSVRADEESRGYAARAVGLILPNIDAYFSGDEPALPAMMEAAHESGKAINISQTTAAHAMSYKLSSLLSIAHGHAVALCLPGVMRHMADAKNPYFPGLCALFGVKDLRALADWFDQLNARLGLRVKQVVSQDALDTLCASVNAQRLANNPVGLSGEDIRRVYRGIFQEDS